MIYLACVIDIVLNADDTRLFCLRPLQLVQQVNRNPEKFGENFAFTLTSDDHDDSRS